MRMLAIVAALPLLACSDGGGQTAATNGVAPQGTGTTRTYPVSGFSAVTLAASDDVDVRVGGAFAVQAIGPADMLDALEIARNGETLTIGRKNGTSFAWGKGRALRVMVTLPELRGAAVSGSGDMAVDRVTADSFAASTSGSGNIRIAQLAAQSLQLSVSGSGTIAAAGQAQRADMSVAGSGDITASRLTIGSAQVSVQGSGDIEATVTGSTTGSIAGSGDITLHGGGTCTISKAGSGDVSCGS